MKTRILTLLGAALLLNAGALAERPTTDEMAIRLGVAAWSSGRAALSQTADIAPLKALYLPDLEATEKLNGAERTARGLAEYAALWQPFFDSLASLSAAPVGDVKLSLDGDRALTTFSFTPQGTRKDGSPLACGASITLTWKRQNGLWRIAREELAPLAAGLSADSARTTQR
ncbi:MAG TPA: nuclear transport factor 2 family protein [Chthoniobacteraceae bacterium]|nr:nuclear transport factor 2 family protein [Chthoniobacteraceae bacterium]